MIHVYREIVTRTLYVCAPHGKRQQKTPRCRNAARAQLSLEDAENKQVGLLTLAQDQPTSLAGVGAEDGNKILDAGNHHQ